MSEGNETGAAHKRVVSHRRTAVVVGAQGVIGRTIAGALLDDGGWDVIGLSRRGGEEEPGLRHIAVDLLDRADARAKLAPLREVTHVFYAAFQDRPSWSELVEPNVAMLVNAVEAIEAAAPGLRHVNLMQGYKVYGAHLGPFKSPARESDPGHMPPEFNVDHERWLTQRSAWGGWSWSALRPAVVAGFALGTPMNIVNVLAMYALLSREAGVPLRFPGAPGAYDSLVEFTDAGLLGRAALWAATDDRAAGEAFNIANGDLYRWRELWPLIAEAFDVPVADPLPMQLTDVMGDKAALWDGIVEANGLEPTPYEQLSSWAFGDGVFAWHYDMFGDTSKSRRAGFGEFVDTPTMFREQFDGLRKRRIVP